MDLIVQNLDFGSAKKNSGLRITIVFIIFSMMRTHFFIQTLAIEVAAGFRIQESEKLGQLLNSVTYNLVPSRGL